MSSSFVFPYCVNTGRWLAQLRSPSVGAHPNAWSLPGGGINKGEDPIEAARREFLEEVGYWPVELVAAGQPRPDVHLFVWPVRREFREDPQALCADESTEHRWFDLDDAPVPMTDWLVSLYSAAVSTIRKRFPAPIMSTMYRVMPS